MRLALVSLTCLLILAAVGCQHAAVFYVSPEGDDGNPGSLSKPFLTLEAARNAVRKTKGDGGATVFLKGGRHFRSTTFELDQRDSGTALAPVVYRAVEGEEVFIDGGRVIPPGACKLVAGAAIRERLVPEARDHILQIDLKQLGITDYGTLGPRGFARSYVPAPLELFINADPLDVAQWPNKGEPQFPMGKVIDKGSVPRQGDFSFRGGVFEYDTPRALRWTKGTDLYISGIFNYGFADDTLRIAEIDTVKGTFKTAQPHLYGFVKRGFTKWYALNLIEEIDLPGEYCVDRSTGVLYFCPPCDVTGALIQVSLMEEPMVAMEGASHVRFQNITFENTRGTGFYIERGTSNLIAGCTFRNMGLVAVQIGKGTATMPDGRHNAHGQMIEGFKARPASRQLGSWQSYLYENTAWNREGGTQHGVLSCDIYNTGAGGVVLGGGDRKTLTPAGNYVENCHIHNVNRWDRMYRTPVNIDGVGNRIRHCHIHNCPGQAILLHGNDHLIELNHMHHVVKDISDQAAIYMGRDPSESGNVIRHNFFHDIYNYHEGGHGVQAIFFDDCCIFGATVVGNVFYKTGNTGVVKFNGGGESPLINNIIVDCPRPIQTAKDNTKRVRDFMKGELGQKRLFQAVDISKPPYSTKYPILIDIHEGRKRVTAPFEHNYVVKGDLSEFVDPANLNFQLKEGSKVYSEIEGFEPIPFDKIGLYRDEYRKE